MLNILVLLGGTSDFFDETAYKFPRPLIEVDGETIIEKLVANLKGISEKHTFIFVIKKEDAENYHLDKSLKLLTDHTCEIIILEGETKGAVCSALTAIKYINHDMPLVISNGDQVIDSNISKIYTTFLNEQYDAGIITFESIHPRWSYARIESGVVVETAEKNPISKQAIAGFYYFSSGEQFVNAAMQLIRKDNNYKGNYYLAPTLNEIILERGTIGYYEIEKENYYTFYSPLKIEEFKNKAVYAAEGESIW